MFKKRPRHTAAFKSRRSHTRNRALRTRIAAGRPLPVATQRNRLDAPQSSRFVIKPSGPTITCYQLIWPKLRRSSLA